MKQNQDPIARLSLFFCALTQPLNEVIEGVIAGTVPWTLCLSSAVLVQLTLLLGIDVLAFQAISLEEFYPSGAIYSLYYLTLVGSPLFIWGAIQTAKKRQLANRLAEVFESIGLRNRLGRLPNFVLDKTLDSSTRKLRLTRAALDMREFERAKGSLEGSLQIYIDEFRENREFGTVDVIYSNYPMPGQFSLGDVGRLKRGQFTVGTTRSAEVVVKLDSVPHLLVAGQTGGGKSTFLRQFILTQYLQDKKAEFLLVDLKGGMEFQLFEGLKRVTVPESTKKVIYEVEMLSGALDKRMAFLKSHRCKDIQEYAKKRREGERKVGPRMNRRFVIVDEAAEMFLAGHHASGQYVQKAKRALSKLARQGRAVGMHLVIATQRPDSRALDPQIKANLTGALCFQMANDISSITVLGNGRATDLPAVPGRGIWKVGGDMIEVQTPFISPKDVEDLVRSHKRVSESDPVCSKPKLLQAIPVESEDNTRKESQNA